MKRIFEIAAFVFCFLLAGCGGGSSSSPPPPTPSASPSLVSITESPHGAPLAIGATQQFTATGSFADGSTKDITSTVTWHSSDESVASISSTGSVTALAVGNATITASSGTVSASGAVIVTPVCGTGTGTLTLGSTEKHLLDVGQYGTEFTPDEHMSYMRQADGSVRLWIAGGTSVEAGDTIGFMSNDLVNLVPLTLSGGNAVPGLRAERPWNG